MHCQRCRLPLFIDPSLQKLSKAQTHLLTSARLGEGSSRDTELGDEPFIPTERAHRLKEAAGEPIVDWKDSGDSFVILPQFEEEEEEEEEDKVVSNRLKTLSSIFNLLSSKGELDYPVCADCSKLLLDSMKNQYDKTVKERDVYVQFLQKLESRQLPDVDSAKKTVAEMDNLRLEEKKLLAQLQSLEQENDGLDEEIRALEAELAELSQEEEQVMKRENKQSLEVSEFLKQRDLVAAEYEFNLRQLEKLRKTNVYNDTFNISHDGPFGTINGLRLGSLDHQRVPWQEINAALGHVVLLLATVTSRLNIRLAGYKLKPMGSTSRIEKLVDDKATVLEAFSSGEYQLERLFTHHKLDGAMEALLEIIQQIATELKKYDQSIDLPYKMTHDKIGDASVKLSSKIAGEEWTSACKFMLTNTKWILAYASAHIR